MKDMNDLEKFFQALAVANREKEDLKKEDNLLLEKIKQSQVDYFSKAHALFGCATCKDASKEDVGMEPCCMSKAACFDSDGTDVMRASDESRTMSPICKYHNPGEPKAYPKEEGFAEFLRALQDGTLGKKAPAKSKAN